MPSQSSVIVNEADGMKPVCRILAKFAQQQAAAQPRTVNQDRARPDHPLKPRVVHQAVGASKAAHQPTERQRMHDEEASRALRRLIDDDE